MKNVFSLIALIFASSSAFAGTVYMDGNEISSLPSCGGIVQTKISNGATQLNVIFKNVSQCSNFDIVKANGEKITYPNQKLQGQNLSRFGSFTIPTSMIELGRNTISIKLQSNSAKHSDTIIVKVAAYTSTPAVIKMSSNDTKTLRACGGTVQTKVNNGKLNIVFRDVENCSNFDIVNANGDKVDYPNLKLNVNSPRNYSGGFTLPNRVISYGGNQVRVKLNSNSGKTSELILINFLAF